MYTWIINHYAISPDSPGGTRHYNFSKELVNHGHKVTIVASSFSHRTRKEEKLKAKENVRVENIDGVGFVWLRTFPYLYGNDWRRVVNMLSFAYRLGIYGLRITEKPDVILASSPHLFAGLAGWFLARIKKARFIFEIRDLWPQTLVDLGGYRDNSLPIWLLRALEKFLYNRASKIISLLPNASTYITDLGIPADKIVYIPNGVSPSLYAYTNNKLPSDLACLLSELKERGKVLLAYTGAHGLANNLITVIETAKLLQDKRETKAHFLLIGEGPEKKALEQLADKWGLYNVSFFRTVQKDSIPGLLKFIDIAINTLRNSPLYKYGVSPNKLFDYMISAKPVIFAINSSNNPIAEAGCGIIVSPENSESMKEAVMKLCDLTEHEREEMGRKGYTYVMRYHSIPKLAMKLQAVIEEKQ
jgi:glycosyltransferase involved in cell wall biosynthesis